MKKVKKINVLRIINIMIIAVLIIIVMGKTGLYADYLIKRFQAILTIVAAGVFCVFNNSNRIEICIKNLGMFICAVIAYIYSYEMNYVKYIIYIVLTIFVVTVTLLIDNAEGKSVSIKKLCELPFNIVRIILIPTILQILNGLNDELRVIVCLIVVALYVKLYNMIFEKNQ